MFSLLLDAQLTQSYVGHPAIPEGSVDDSSDIQYLYIERSAAMTVPQPGTISTWALYSKSPAHVAMMVVRPVPGSNIEFSVVGMNDMKAQKGKTETQVAASDRISVKPGDIISWYYKPGTNPTVT